MALKILEQNRELARSVVVASSFVERLCGLIGTHELPRERALVLPHCSMVHMFFMRYPIDVLFLNKKGVVLAVINELRPWRVSPSVRGAFYAVELASGVATTSGVCVGDTVVWSESNESPASRQPAA